ncbi:hypothetical protein [Mesobacillus campisalis]|uniref:hypothetical protein n=1 Tax=Mesobacillus campisalis TaxID=1408103 RepID=UPI000A9E4196|nr:hypothetical protein [Mesobacillus campisalis]
MKGKTVIYLGKEYTLFFQYESGYCEIMKNEAIPTVKLVHISELKQVNEKNSNQN